MAGSPFAAFRALLATPGGRTQAIFGLMGRAPGAMLSVGFVAAAASAGGEAGYALGGLAAGSYALATAFAGPTIGRLVDQRGQRRLGRQLALVSAAAAVAAVVVLLTLGASWLLVPLAGLAGATQPNVGAFARVRWAELLAGKPEAQTAQAFESIIDEVTFLIGPPLVAILASAWFNGLPIVLAASFLVAGTFVITSTRALPMPTPHPDAGLVSRWRPEFPAGIGLLLATAFLGGALGAVQVLQLAYTDALGMAEGAALVFFLNSGASLAGAVVVGGLTWRTGPRRRFTIALVGYAVCLVPSALVSGYWPFVAASALAGLAISPTFIQANAVVAEETPARSRTAAFAVIASAAGLGIALGAALAGNVVASVGGDAGRLLLLPLAALAGGIAVLAELLHRPQPVTEASAH